MSEREAEAPHHVSGAGEWDEYPIWAMFLAGVGVLIVPVLLLIWVSDPSNPESLLYALIIANAVPILWNWKTSRVSSFRGQVELISTQALAYATTILIRYVKRWFPPVDLPWTELGFTACCVLGALLAAQTIYRPQIKRYFEDRGRRKAETSRPETVFPRL